MCVHLLKALVFLGFLFVFWFFGGFLAERKSKNVKKSAEYLICTLSVKLSEMQCSKFVMNQLACII